MLVQLLTSCPDIFNLSSSNKHKKDSYYRRPSYSTYEKLPSYDPPCSLPSSVCDSSFKILASLQLSVRVLGSEFSCLSKSVTSTSESPLPCGDNNPPNLRKQGKLALTFALRKYNDVPSEDRIRIANELESEIDRHFVGGHYREKVYRFGGLLTEDGGRELVMGLIDGRMSVESVLFRNGNKEEEILIQI